MALSGVGKHRGGRGGTDIVVCLAASRFAREFALDLALFDPLLLPVASQCILFGEEVLLQNAIGGYRFEKEDIAES